MQVKVKIGLQMLLHKSLCLHRITISYCLQNILMLFNKKWALMVNDRSSEQINNRLHSIYNVDDFRVAACLYDRIMKCLIGIHRFFNSTVIGNISNSAYARYCSNNSGASSISEDSTVCVIGVFPSVPTSIFGLLIGVLRRPTKTLS